MTPPNQPTVAILGGGLCGLALAVALKRRRIPFTVYEARSSFTELGAGINVGPNSYQALQLIDESLAEGFIKQAARNPPGKEEVWFQVRYGAPALRIGHEGREVDDAELVYEFPAPPTGNMTVGRNGLLQLLAEKAGLLGESGIDKARFNKKLLSFQQASDSVTLYFEDGTTAQASVVIACDGIHSAVRRSFLGSAAPAAIPQYSNAGAYRALLPKADLAKAIGEEMASCSQVFLGPEGYLLMYPISPETINVGFWTWKRGGWPHRDWVLPNQKQEMEKDFGVFGETVKKIMSLAGDPSFYATHYHAIQPEHCWEGRVCLIGDAAHAMPPHCGAGAGQAMEDSVVMAEVLSAVFHKDAGQESGVALTQKGIEAAFRAYDAVRTARSQRVVELSVKGMGDWIELYRGPITTEREEAWKKLAQKRLGSIWRYDVAAGAREAVEMVRRELAGEQMVPN